MTTIKHGNELFQTNQPEQCILAYPKHNQSCSQAVTLHGAQKGADKMYTCPYKELHILPNKELHVPLPNPM